MDLDAEYYYSDGAQLYGPLKLGQLIEMARDGMIDPDIQITPGGDDDWQPLNEVAEIPPPTKPQKATARAPRTTASTPKDSKLSRWPQAIFIGLAFLVADFLIPIGDFNASFLDPWVILFATIAQLFVAILALFAYRLCCQARKRSPISGFKSFLVGLLQVLLFLAGIGHALYFGMNGFRAYNSFNFIEHYATYAPSEFRSSILSGTASNIIGDDALVIKEIVPQPFARTYSFETLLGRNISPPVWEYVNMRDIHERMRKQAIVDSLSGVTNQFEAQLFYTEAMGTESSYGNAYSDMEQKLARIYGFPNWEALRAFVFENDPEWLERNTF